MLKMHKNVPDEMSVPAVAGFKPETRASWEKCQLG